MPVNEKRLGQQLRTFEKILTEYKFEEPLARFLAGYYKQNKQMGSNDRRAASRLLYNYFRLGTGLPDLNLNERRAIAEFLCSESSDVVQFLDPSLFSHLEMRLDEKLAFLEKAYGFSISMIFPFVDKISKIVNVDRFLKSHFQQPNLFIRIHTGKESFVKAALKDN